MAGEETQYQGDEPDKLHLNRRGIRCGCVLLWFAFENCCQEQ